MKSKNNKSIVERINEGSHQELLAAVKAKHVVVGDILEINSQEYFYKGMSKHGKNGQYKNTLGILIPYFTPVISNNGNSVRAFYISTLYWRKVIRD